VLWFNTLAELLDLFRVGGANDDGIISVENIPGDS
jgi:hypothetical protein